jgi:hypothetical protein
MRGTPTAPPYSRTKKHRSFSETVFVREKRGRELPSIIEKRKFEYLRKIAIFAVFF